MLPAACVQVDQVYLPGGEGEFGVLPGHVPTIAQLKPGVLAVHIEADKNVKKARPALAPPLVYARNAAVRAPTSFALAFLSPKDAPSQYFVSSGFAFIHADSTTDVCAVEAVPLEQLNPDSVKQVTLLPKIRPAPPCTGGRRARRLACLPPRVLLCFQAGLRLPPSHLFVSRTQSLADFQAKLVNAKDDYERAAAQIGIEVTSAMAAALGA